MRSARSASIWASICSRTALEGSEASREADPEAQQIAHARRFQPAQNWNHQSLTFRRNGMVGACALIEQRVGGCEVIGTAHDARGK